MPSDDPLRRVTTNANVANSYARDFDDLRKSLDDIAARAQPAVMTGQPPPAETFKVLQDAAEALAFGLERLEGPGLEQIRGSAAALSAAIQRLAKILDTPAAEARKRS